MLVAVTDHAVDRFRQRISSRRGDLDPRPEIATRVRRAVEAGRIGETPPAGARVGRGSLYVRDLQSRSLVFVCRRDRPGADLLVVTMWEVEDGPGEPRVPRRFTDALDEPRAPRP
jgi:hypothetical protein